MPAEVFVNVGESTLAAPALSTDTTLTLLAGAPFPAVGQYRIRLDDSLQQPGGIATRYEINRATFNAGNVINVFSTGVDLEGTTSQGWPIGTAVRAIITAAGLKAAIPPFTTPYKARAYRSAAASQAAGSQAVPLDTVTYDPNSNFTTGTAAHYTCPVAGYYQVDGRAGTTTTGLRCFSAIYKNGVEYSRGSDGAATSPAQIAGSVSDVVSCAAGDTLALWVYVSGTATLEVGAAVCRISIHYLSS